MGGDLDKQMAPGEVIAGEAVLFRSEDESNAAVLREGRCYVRSELVEGYDGLFGLAMGKGSGAQDQGAVAYGFGESSEFLCGLEQLSRADGGTRFAPVRLIGRDDAEACKPEVGHGPRHRTDIQWVARRDEDDFDAIALVWSEQRMIVEPEM